MNTITDQEKIKKICKKIKKCLSDFQDKIIDECIKNNILCISTENMLFKYILKNNTIEIKFNVNIRPDYSSIISIYLKNNIKLIPIICTGMFIYDKKQMKILKNQEAVDAFQYELYDEISNEVRKQQYYSYILNNFDGKIQ